jgi:peptidoglycan/LPS O-acetylase OafA/YrhL
MSTTTTERKGAWATAQRLAAETPAGRNRYADFLRAVSILAVVVGHWLIAAVAVRGGQIDGANLLATDPWTQWLTWGFQVMPIFFVVGGFSNAASWRSTAARGGRYGEWLGSRVRRLVMPAVPLVVAWSGLAIVVRILGVSGDLVRLGSQAALIPLWFLAVYVLVVALAPITLWLWERWGMGSFVALAALAAMVDALSLGTGGLAGWFNFLFVWAAVHQLGYAWKDGRFADPGRALMVGTGGLLALVALVTAGPYPVSMVGVPGADVGNNSPPTVALIALGLAQTGIALAVARPVSRWLEGRRAWAATILVNGSIMTVYLWHLTAMVLVLGAAALAGGFGLGIEPASKVWWLARPLWMALYATATLGLLRWFGRYERPSAMSPMGTAAALTVVVLACFGFASIAGGGIADDGSWIRPLAIIPILVAGALASGLRFGGRRAPAGPAGHGRM